MPTPSFLSLAGLRYENRQIMGTKENEVFRLSDIVYSKIKGELDPGEEKEFEKWLDSALGNKVVFEELSSEEALWNKYREYKAIRLEEELGRFERKRLSRRKRRIYSRISGYAAAVLAVGAFGLYRTIHTAPEHDRTPGNVELILDNGRRIALTDTTFLSSYGAWSANVSANKNGIDYRAPETNLLEESEQVWFHTLEIPRGADFKLTLTDNTEVWLNSESKIRYPVAFTGDSREVYVEGEAYFKVSENREMPFRVISGDVSVTVLGTEFNYRAYPEESRITTTLVSGAVRMEELGRESAIELKPGEQASWFKERQTFETASVNTYPYTAWKEGRFVFSDTRLDDLLSMLSRWYDLEIVYEQASARAIRFTGDLSKEEDFHNILKIIEQNGRVTFSVKGRHIAVKLLY